MRVGNMFWKFPVVNPITYYMSLVFVILNVITCLLLAYVPIFENVLLPEPMGGCFTCNEYEGVVFREIIQRKYFKLGHVQRSSEEGLSYTSVENTLSIPVASGLSTAVLEVSNTLELPTSSGKEAKRQIWMQILELKTPKNAEKSAAALLIETMKLLQKFRAVS